MTWRAFIIGLLGVIGLNLFTPVNDYAIGNTFLTGNHFPVGVFFFLLLLTLVMNVLIKLVWARQAFRQAELMLIWCMMLVSATVPASGLMRYWFPITASAPYLAQRPDKFWEDDVLPQAPEGILLSKNPKSVAARKFYDGTPQGEVIRVPWSQWTSVFLNWGVYIWLFWLASFFMCGMFRRQWVESERLLFPLARVPLEFTEGSESRRLLPPLVRQKAFLLGAAVTIIFGLVRLSPLLFGATEGWRVFLPIRQVFADTDLWRLQVQDGWVFPIGIGFAFLVPSDISLSMWFFYLFMCVQLQVAYYLGRPIEGGPWGAFMEWQEAGAFIAFTVGLLWTSRRHLAAVARKAFGLGRDVDDSAEPISYGLSFWGLLICLAGLVAWNVWFGMGVGVAVILIALFFTVMFVHARLIAQGGLFLTQHNWSAPDLIHDISGGRAFSGAGAVLAQTQYAILIADSREILSPHAMNALRISAVFEKRRRLLLPIMLVALLAAMVASGYSTLRWVFYDVGALNIKQLYSVVSCPIWIFDRTSTMISSPGQSAMPQYGALFSGGFIMLAFMALRSAFYWWPIHPIGFVVSQAYCIRQLWFSFLLGWLAKACILKFGTGPVLRSARTFFLAVIITEIAVIGITTFISLITGVSTGYVFLSA
jgi:hypothetical protein